MGLEAILRPRSVAVIGASNRRGTIGAELFRNLLKNEFQGPVYPVHPSARAIFGVQAHKDIGSVPDEVDLAIIVVKRSAVLEVAQACADKGVRGLVVITAGFKESGPEGQAAEEALLEIIRAHDMRLIGPNCLGVVTTCPEIHLDATFAPTFPPEGKVALASQSGALGVAMLDTAATLNIGVSDFVSIGNKADVSANDLLEFWQDDPRTRVILLYLESFGNPRKFASIAREVSAKKPIVAVKSGRSSRGLLAASSHTGSLAGGEAAVSALVEQCGLIRVDTVEELFDMASFLAHQPLPEGRRVGILTNAGGPGIMATDACEGLGLEVAELSDALQESLMSVLPDSASAHNPVDMVASASPEQYEHCARELLASSEVDALLALFVPPIVTDSAEVARAIAKAASGFGKPVVACFMGKHEVQAVGSLSEAQIPSFSFPESAVRVLSRASRYCQWLSRPKGEIPKLANFDLKAACAIVAKAAADVDDDGSWMSADEVDALLDAIGLDHPPTTFAKSAGEAAEVARSLGFPVVLKMVATDVSHKSDLGGVKVDLRNEGEVFGAYESIANSATAHGVSLEGVLVQPLIKGGVETIVGISRDVTVGSLLMFGLGGVHVELLRDVAFRIPPLTDHDAHALVRAVRGFPLLDGYRGSKPSDVAALEDALLRVSALATHCPLIAEMDLNPLSIMEEGCIAIDCRILVRPLD